ncbi:F0F1 ATP synthase subunit delta [Candidatus Peregrinibacteria bacterium]|nr:F0F1 ATP synthase subunit delta [Candidatus Peregrinibacteria bacterium]
MKTTPKVYAEALAALIEKGGASQELAAGLVNALRKNHQEKLLNRILDLCEKILMGRRGEIKVKVISARELTDSQLEKFKQMVADSTKLKPIVEHKVEKGLRGGVKLAVSDYMIDSTIAGRLQTFARYLVSNGNAAAQHNAAHKTSAQHVKTTHTN